MKFRKCVATIFLLTVVFGVMGCSKDMSKKTNKSSSEVSTQTVSKNKPLKKFNAFFGKKYFFIGSYKSKKAADLNSVSWKKESGQYAFTFVKKGRAFAGKYVNDKLSYGRMYKFSETKNNFFNFKEQTFVIAEGRYNKLNQEEKKRFTLINSEIIPGASKDVHYYQSKSVEDLRGDVSYRFYFKNSSLIRETKQKNGTYFYAKNITKD